ncbi:MAG: DUF5667 domain-containing protein, partial [Anaerolineae bacterium]
MNKLLSALLIINLVLIGLAGGMAYLAETYPFQPGDSLYDVQRTAEYLKLQLTAGQKHQAEIALEIVGRRLTDLAGATEPDAIAQTANFYNQWLNEAIVRIDAAPTTVQEELYGRLHTSLRQAEVVFGALDTTENELLLKGLRYKINTLLTATSSEQVIATLPDELRPATRIDPVIVPFLEQDVEHVNFPLSGGHEGLE